MAKKGSANTTDRVNIKAEVETRNGKVKVKVPFVTGVMASLSGANASSLPSVAERQFIDFNTENFGKRMASIRPSLNFTVDNKMNDAGGKLAVQMDFQSMDDFSPGNVAKNVEPLRKLLVIRRKLEDMKSRASGYESREKAVKLLLESMRGSAAK